MGREPVVESHLKQSHGSEGGQGGIGNLGIHNHASACSANAHGAELAEVIVAAQRTVARSRALIAEVDAVLAREKSLLLAPRDSSFDAGR